MYNYKLYTIARLVPNNQFKWYSLFIDVFGNQCSIMVVTARDELQVHYDTFIEEYSIKLVFLTNTRYKHTIN